MESQTRLLNQDRSTLVVCLVRRITPHMGQHDHLYNLARWKRLRQWQLRRMPLCERCTQRDGTITPATVAHHVKAHKGNLDLFFDPANLASSCKPCHDIDEQRVERGRGLVRRALDADGWPI